MWGQFPTKISTKYSPKSSQMCINFTNSNFQVSSSPSTLPCCCYWTPPLCCLAGNAAVGQLRTTCWATSTARKNLGIWEGDLCPKPRNGFL